MNATIKNFLSKAASDPISTIIAALSLSIVALTAHDYFGPGIGDSQGNSGITGALLLILLFTAANLVVQGGVRLLYSGVRCCSMYWRMISMGAPPQLAAK